MAAIHRITDERGAVALADLLNGHARRRPVVVVTTPAGQAEPWVDVEQVAREAGNLAEVKVMPTGPLTWEFSRRMPDGTQVYGGASRVYPVGHEWASDLSKSPLHFAFNADDGERVTQQLISDTFRMAAAAGVLQAPSRHQLRRAQSVVTLVVAGRALVDVGNRLPASIAEELTVADVPIDRIVSAGQRIEGWYDPASNRLDITPSLRGAGQALAAYAVDDVVLTRVAKVRGSRCELMLYPKTSAPAVVVTVLRAEVTTNPADDLRTLMTVGEVIPARVVATGPSWALRLNDIDDDEPTVAAPALVDGGPPWLVEEADEPLAEEPHLDTQRALAMPTVLAPAPAEPESTRAVPSAAPSPILLDRHRADLSPVTPPVTPATPPPAPPAPTGRTTSSTTRALLLQIDTHKAEITRLKRVQDELATQLQALTDEREQLRYLRDQAERRAHRAEHDLKAARARLRKASTSRTTPAPVGQPKFADPEQGFRYAVLTQWALRTQPGEQAERPLPDYRIGPGFLASLAKLEGIKPEKVADVVFEIVTGLAPQQPGREVHRLRSGTGGDDPVRTRDDGAVAYRASLQANSPSARRIHYWVLPNQQIELGRVTTHDDYQV